MGALAVVDQYLNRRTTPLGALVRGVQLPTSTLFLLGSAAVVGLAVFGFVQSVRTAELFEIRPDGLRVRGHLGTYVVAWENVAQAGVTSTGALGLKLRSRERLVETHVGTAQQRTWLETLEPWGDWDLLYPRAALGSPADTVLEWLSPHLHGKG